MKRGCISTILILLFALGMQASEPFLDSVKVDGHMRKFWLRLPEKVTHQTPLVLYLHGYGNPGNPWCYMDQAADQHGFALCIPIGLKDPAGKPSWNVGYPPQDGWKMDDAKAMCRLASYVQKKYGVSRVNTFLTGMSNGGDMCYVLAYSGQKTFRAFGSVAGLTMEWVYRTKEAPRPIPIMEVHGTEDRVSEWGGDLQNKGGWGKYMSTPQSVGYWVAKNRCEGLTEERVAGLRDNGLYILKHKYEASQTTGCDVWLYEVVGGSHSTFQDDINVGEEIWSFFSKYLQ